MIRMIQLILDNIRNVKHGEIRFRQTPRGGSVTGIYGQNGSGKTSVIDAIDLLATLMAGQSPQEGTAGIVNAASGEGTIAAVLRVDDHDGEPVFVSYRATLRNDGAGNAARLVSEGIRMGGSESRLGRELLSVASGSPADSGNPAIEMLPSYAWRSMGASSPALRDDILFHSRDAFRAGASFLFRAYRGDGGEATTMLRHIAVTAAGKDLSGRARALLDTKVLAASRAADALARWAKRDVRVVNTRRGASPAFWLIPIPSADTTGGTDVYFNLRGATVVPSSRLPWLRDVIDTYNRILPGLVPGIRIELKETPAPSDGHLEDRTMVELLSDRDGTRIRFGDESEGVVRLTSLLSLLIHAYNEESALVAVDELDMGVFELLLGDLLEQFADGCHGQLVFTAHNLRALETLDHRSIWLTTTDPGDRFIPAPSLKPTNNQRKTYLADLMLGWDGPDLYDKPPVRRFGTALYRAGHPRTAARSRPRGA